MGKRKTLKQKRITDTRKQTAHGEVPSQIPSSSSFTYSFSTTHKLSSNSSPITTAVTDVRKTALISLVIVAFQIIFFMLLQNHVLALPFVRY